MEQKETKAFSIAARTQSFKHAFRGIGLLVATAHNAWVEIFSGLVVLALGLYFRISAGETLALVISFGMLFMAEAFNTGMEVHMNLTSPGQHPFARDTKDVAASAVLVAVVVFLVVAAIVFVPYITDFVSHLKPIGPRYT